MKKILSIDGGGIKGVFPASFLATLEDATGANISDFFDLIVGTSTGGIIALGLGLGVCDFLDFRAFSRHLTLLLPVSLWAKFQKSHKLSG
jgi:patatin-like phospholipase/acyl hydrolase